MSSVAIVVVELSGSLDISKKPITAIELFLILLDHHSVHLTLNPSPEGEGLSSIFDGGFGNREE